MFWFLFSDVRQLGTRKRLIEQPAKVTTAIRNTNQKLWFRIDVPYKAVRMTGCWVANKMVRRNRNKWVPTATLLLTWGTRSNVFRNCLPNASTLVVVRMTAPIILPIVSFGGLCSVRSGGDASETIWKNRCFGHLPKTHSAPLMVDETGAKNRS